MGVKKQTEKSFMQAVAQYARLRGWSVYHTLDSRGSSAGFPDLVFSRDDRHECRIVVVELKLDGKAATGEQMAWLQAFKSTGIPTHLWTPSDWPNIEVVLGELP